MSRTYLWSSLAFSAIIYQGLRMAFGLEAKPEDALACIYWTGAALAIQWAINEGKIWPRQ